MAYLDLQQAFAGGAEIRTLDPQASRTGREGGLSPLEWLVVAVAERDPLASLRNPGRVAGLFGKLFGRASSNGFANPRLEALRRIAVLHWRKGDAVDRQEISSFLAAGYSLAQHQLVAASIAKGRAAKRNGSHAR
jgi:hypothetical protein